MKRIALALTVAMILAALGSSVAVADPINSKKAEFFDLTCNNGQEFTVVGISGNPGHIVGTNGNIVSTEITVTATDPDTGEVLYSEMDPVGQGKKVGLDDDLITCTTELGTYYVPLLGQVATVRGTIEGFLTPRGQ
jgi:ABC-type Fe3+-hydroxamate transport system substrate-binding protein